MRLQVCVLASILAALPAAAHADYVGAGAGTEAGGVLVHEYTPSPTTGVRPVEIGSSYTFAYARSGTGFVTALRCGALTFTHSNAHVAVATSVTCTLTFGGGVVVEDSRSLPGPTADAELVSAAVGPFEICVTSAAIVRNLGNGASYPVTDSLCRTVQL